MLIPLDIETLPTEDPAVIAEIADGINHPGNMSKPETIARWEAEEKPALVKQAILKTALDGTYGRVLCVGWAIDNAAPRYFIDADESIVLAGFMHAMMDFFGVGRLDQSAIFVGHNISGFDLRFLWQRCIIKQVPMPATLLMACRAKAWDKSIADTMLMWNPDNTRRISLVRLCRALGVPTSKGDMDGSKVYDAFLAGELAKIGEYCAGDVTDVLQCYKRMVFQ